MSMVSLKKRFTLIDGEVNMFLDRIKNKESKVEGIHDLRVFSRLSVFKDKMITTYKRHESGSDVLMASLTLETYVGFRDRLASSPDMYELLKLYDYMLA